METSGGESQQNAFLDRTSRPTRGKRMTKLLDDELEEDELFWNQDALKDEEHDDEYEEEGDAVDVFDSDFDEDEHEADEEAEKEPDERTSTKKKVSYPGMPTKKNKKKMKVLSKIDVASTSNKTLKNPTASDPHDAPDDVEAEKSLRKSTRTSVVVRQAERDAIRVALEATTKPIIRKKKEGDEKRMTQEDMLLDAAQTEIMNLKTLERVLAREEEVKKRAIVHKEVYSGPQIRYLSKDGQSYLEFMNGASFKSELPGTSVRYPKKALCPITGLPAIYRDPRTGTPYATKEAFKIIRERFEKQNNSTKKESLGILSDPTYQQGFSRKRKRSMIARNKETYRDRKFARFQKNPSNASIEVLDSD